MRKLRRIGGAASRSLKGLVYYLTIGGCDCDIFHFMVTYQGTTFYTPPHIYIYIKYTFVYRFVITVLFTT